MWVCVWKLLNVPATGLEKVPWSDVKKSAEQMTKQATTGISNFLSPTYMPLKYLETYKTSLLKGIAMAKLHRRRI